MKAFFEAIQFLFVEVLFVPMDFLRSIELTNWWVANIINWVFIFTCCYWAFFWTKQLQIFKKSGADEQDTSAHSFLTK
ncbi:uracil phosphoribosyltransferase [Flavobacterium sp.]|jgi:hypothetical protein|uniref:DUF6341 family protein n=1 Tax=Flavobacterium sp. TaxID=239 RepID=UPI0037BECA19